MLDALRSSFVKQCETAVGSSPDHGRWMVVLGRRAWRYSSKARARRHIRRHGGKLRRFRARGLRRMTAWEEAAGRYLSASPTVAVLAKWHNTNNRSVS
jgi:hypothetical protein